MQTQKRIFMLLFTTEPTPALELVCRNFDGRESCVYYEKKQC